ncbi:P-loop containing nucleoside triphosphate hydrolase protein [Aspergillus californicus]
MCFLRSTHLSPVTSLPPSHLPEYFTLLLLLHPQLLSHQLTHEVSNLFHHLFPSLLTLFLTSFLPLLTRTLPRVCPDCPSNQPCTSPLTVVFLLAKISPGTLMVERSPTMDVTPTIPLGLETPRPARPDNSMTLAERSTSRMSNTTKESSPIPIDILTQSMAALVKKIQDLRHLGVEDSQITLPKICVIGDQSTGKSSLIEGMSEIKVPRSAGTCTRCPMEINLSESEPGQPWTCHVFLSRKYIFKPKKFEHLDPWIEQEREDEAFTTITDKALMEEAIRCAQLAILNPSSPSANYIPGKNGDIDPQLQVKFSPNIVRLDISAPGFPNLSFYDLPGVINQPEFDEERYLVVLVDKLVKEYIRQENCIVLLTITMTDDVMNSSAARIMRDVRGAKSRTLGVLTKPDRVQPGDPYAQWIEILEGDKFALGHGYYVVRNNPDPSVEHSVARQEEEEFFKSHPWVAELGDYRERFGTRNLQSALSHLLLKQIQGCLPQIIAKINDKAARIEAELSSLPPPPSANAPYILSGKIHTLKDRIRCQIDGGSREYPLQKIWTSIADDFKQALFKTRPTVKLLSELDKQHFSPDHNDDSDCEMTLVQYSVKRKRSEEDSTEAAPIGSRERTQKPPPYQNEEFKAFTHAAKVFTWEEIRNIKRELASAGSSDQVNPKAIDYMNQMSVAHWENPMLVFIDASHRLMKDTLLQELQTVFVQYQRTGLYRELKKVIEGYMNKLHFNHVAHVDETYSIEHHKPFTMANTTLEAAKEQARQDFELLRLKARANHYLDIQQKWPRGDPRREAEKKKIGDKELGSDPFKTEINMMAASRGYYEIASSRFVDSICQSVYTKLFFKCRENLIDAIEDELGIKDENGEFAFPLYWRFLVLTLLPVSCREMQRIDVRGYSASASSTVS